MSEASVEARLWLMAIVIAEGRHCDKNDLHWLLPWEPVVYCGCGWGVELSEDEIRRVLDGTQQDLTDATDDPAMGVSKGPGEESEETRDGMA